jgi:hypothetical protein
MRITIYLIALLLFGAAWAFAADAPFMSGYYENIRWTSHTSPTFGEVEGKGQIDEGKIDVDGDGAEEDIKVTWGEGVNDHSLAIEITRFQPEKVSLGILGPITGIQPNYKLEDIDQDGRLEVIIWGGLWDYEISAEAELGPHRYVVAIYKLLSGGYALWDVYTTRTKYDPYFLRTEKGIPA